MPGKVTKITEESSAKSDNSLLFLTSEVYNPNSDLSATDVAMIGSPLKKPRSNTTGLDDEIRRTTTENLAKGLGFGFTSSPVKTESKAETDSSVGEPSKPNFEENLITPIPPAANLVQKIKAEDEV